MTTQFNKTSALVLAMAASGLLIPGEALTGTPGLNDHSYTTETSGYGANWPSIPETVTSVPGSAGTVSAWTNDGTSGAWTSLGADSALGTSVTDSNAGIATVEPVVIGGYEFAPSAQQTTAAPLGTATSAVAGSQTVAATTHDSYAGGYAPVAEYAPTTDYGHAPAFGSGHRDTAPYYGGGDTVQAISGTGALPVPLHRESNLSTYTSPIYKSATTPSYESAHSYVAPTHHAPVYTQPAYTPPPVYTRPPPVYTPPAYIPPAPPVYQPPRVVEKKVYVDRPVYVPRPVDRIVEKKVYVDRPIYVKQRVVVDRPIYVPKPVDRPVYVEKRVPVPYPVVRRVPVDRAVYVEKRVAVPVDRPVAVDRPVYVEKRVPVPYPVERRVPVDRPVYVEKRVPYPVATPVPVPRPYMVEKRIPVPYAVERQVPVDRPVYVEKRVPVPYPVERQVPVHIPTPVHVPTPVHASCGTVSLPALHAPKGPSSCGLGHSGGLDYGWSSHAAQALATPPFAAPMTYGTSVGAPLPSFSWTPKAGPNLHWIAEGISRSSAQIAEGKNRGMISEDEARKLRSEIEKLSKRLSKARKGGLDRLEAGIIAASLRELSDDITRKQLTPSAPHRWAHPQGWPHPGFGPSHFGSPNFGFAGHPLPRHKGPAMGQF